MGGRGEYGSMCAMFGPPSDDVVTAIATQSVIKLKSCEPGAGRAVFNPRRHASRRSPSFAGRLGRFLDLLMDRTLSTFGSDGVFFLDDCGP